MSEKEQQSNARRAILKRLAGTGAVISGSALLPGKWAKPVVNTIVMPGHAQTSAIGSLPASFTSPGFSRFVVPADVNEINIDMSGGGGGAGGGVLFTGGHGGEGERVATSLAVSPGETLTIEVGAGGNGGALGTKGGGGGFGGEGGGASSVNNIFASGGGGGGGEGPPGAGTPGGAGEGPNGGAGGNPIIAGPTSAAQGGDGGSGDGAEGGRGDKGGDGSDGEHGYVLLS